MENSQHLNEKIHEKLSNWQSKLDYIQLQLSLGTKEVGEEFQKQKKLMHDYLHNYIQIGAQIKETSKEKVDEVKKIISEYKEKLMAEEKATESVISKHKNSIKELAGKLNNI